MKDLHASEQSPSLQDATQAAVPDQAPPSQLAMAPTLDRGLLQRKLARRVQRKAEGRGETSDSVHAAADQALSGSGGALPHGDAIQRAFGHHDVSGIQAHTDGAAAAGTSAMGAEAFATGNQVAFAGTPTLHTAAHEAAHVVQQRAGVHLKGGVGEEGDSHEQHADAVADAVVRGQSAEPLLDRYAGMESGARAGSGPVQRQLVKNQKTDGPYGWTSAYDASFDDKTLECHIVVRVKLVPKDDKVTKDDIANIKRLVATHFPAIWDNKFKLTDTKTKKSYALRISVAWVDAKEHVAVTLNHGSGYANQTNWYANPIGDVTPAHELGHTLGLKDEYVDANVPDRKDDKGVGAHKDNSIMGDYLSEGEGKAEAKLRHAQTLATDIGAATGGNYTAEKNAP